MFDVAAEAYGRFMGRFAEPLAGPFADRAGVAAGMSALDVGCGPGALTAELVRRLGPGRGDGDRPVARRSSPPCAPGSRWSTYGRGWPSSCRFADGSFDVVLAQLVVHFMADPVAGLAEMRRVAQPGGRVAACVWDHGGDGGPLSAFWRAARDLDPDAPDERNMPGVREGHLAELSAGGRTGRHRAQHLGGHGRVHLVRPVVGAVPAGRRAGWARTSANSTRPISRPCGTTARRSCRRAVHGPGVGLVCGRPGLNGPHWYHG